MKSFLKTSIRLFYITLHKFCFSLDFLELKTLSWGQSFERSVSLSILFDNPFEDIHMGVFLIFGMLIHFQFIWKFNMIGNLHFYLFKWSLLPKSFSPRFNPCHTFVMSLDLKINLYDLISFLRRIFVILWLY